MRRHRRPARRSVPGDRHQPSVVSQASTRLTVSTTTRRKVGGEPPCEPPCETSGGEMVLQMVLSFSQSASTKSNIKSRVLAIKLYLWAAAGLAHLLAEN
ncbi:hypothetical protein GQ53DRAFT_102763 [Thozetella sp. PMI_491]|nr:hypothetical protein GQ53DRAFT_102763 [Thozetella sp. PMI_491]